MMSGSTLVISREKGGVQVREMMESSGMGVAVREPTAGRRPRCKDSKQSCGFVDVYFTSLHAFRVTFFLHSYTEYHISRNMQS